MSEGASTAIPHVLTLIPEESFIVFFDAAAVPDGEVQSELRMMAYERQDAPVLGIGGVIQEALTLAAALATVAQGGAVAFPAIRRYLARWRSRSGTPSSKADASKIAGEAAKQVELTTDVPPAARHPSGGWQVTFRDGERAVDIRIEETGAWAELDIRAL